jgi:streptomycin 6-kinase
MVLKVPFEYAEESRTGAISVAMSSHGGVEVIEADLATGALLMPKLGASLDQTGLSDAERVGVCARVIEKLRTCVIRAGTMTVADYNNELVREASFLRLRAAEIASNLSTTATETRLLHGDLHHANILSSGDEWVAIDPKGLVGDPAFEITGYMRNPIQVIDKDTLRQRLQLFHTALGDPIDRLWGWSFSQTSVCGHGTDGEFTRCCLQTATNLWQIRREFGWA